MTKRKSMESLDKQIEETQQMLKVAKARYDRLATQLQKLDEERTMRQAELIADAMKRSGKSLNEVLTFLRC